ncbi:SpoIVB peptidase [Crassaminicella thermophila]|uniref:SpoIVB peptidase n=1 Tax=Crassaminicella thermophila TaxID=2599308 RepID=A0A5C0SDX5_CRATE|nr:SpoIVB peptidase [Crassaminicella thermophila]QEK12162.1 SpoIVB peptidase [Crassaminicella thermophila]
MYNNKNKRRLLFFFIVVLFTFIYSFTLKEIVNYPNKIRIFEDEKHVLNIKFPFQIDTKKLDKSILELLSQKENHNSNRIYINPIKTGQTNFQVKLLGIIPIRNVKVDVIPKIKVVPGGQCIGVRLNTKGVLVVGLEEIKGIDGKKHNPSREAGLTIGDSILEINNIKIKDAQHVTNIINANKNTQITLKVKRRQKIFYTKITPIKSIDEGEYRIGLWVRDKTAGVGTLTFYHSDTMKFGALGHAITDIDTGLLLTVDNGEIVKSKVASIQQGKRGKPGEIKGIFYETSKPIGNLEKNTRYGIYGKAYKPIENNIYNKPIEIAYQNEIKKGKATILTTIDNNKIEEYEIYIEKVNRQRMPNTKSMVIRITDKRLLKKSGGIVQGMSGSPIIQNGKLIGAVTHVFVNDPSKGYGLFIEWMIKEAGINIYNKSQIAESVNY